MKILSFNEGSSILEIDENSNMLLLSKLIIIQNCRNKYLYVTSVGRRKRI